MYGVQQQVQSTPLPPPPLPCQPQQQMPGYLPPPPACRPCFEPCGGPPPQCYPYPEPPRPPPQSYACPAPPPPRQLPQSYVPVPPCEPSPLPPRPLPQQACPPSATLPRARQNRPAPLPLQCPFPEQNQDGGTVVYERVRTYSSPGGRRVPLLEPPNCCSPRAPSPADSTPGYQHVIWSSDPPVQVIDGAAGGGAGGADERASRGHWLGNTRLAPEAREQSWSSDSMSPLPPFRPAELKSGEGSDEACTGKFRPSQN